jgi:cbb3-type cytochrome oxidase subunit 3
MLESMEKFKHLVVNRYFSFFFLLILYFVFQPGTAEQSDKLRVIIENLEEQKAGYVNLLNLITVNSMNLKKYFLLVL